MLSESIPHLYRHVAQRIQDAAVPDKNHTLMQLCSKALFEYADNYSLFCEKTVAAVSFMEQLHDEASRCFDNTDFSDGNIYDSAFFIFECLACILREKSLRQAVSEGNATQEQLLQHFEECGHWFKGDGTLVSDHYFFHIPKTVSDQ